MTETENPMKNVQEESLTFSDSTTSKLPPMPSSAKKPFAWVKRQKAPYAKPVLPVVELKKAAKLLAGLGKSVGAIEVFPHGGFRVELAGQSCQSMPQLSPNPWDQILND